MKDVLQLMPLAEQVFHLLDQSWRRWLVVYVHGFSQLGHQFALRTAQFLGNLHYDVNDQIAMSAFVQIRNTSSAHANLAPALRAFRNPDGDWSVDARNFKFRTHGCLREADWNDAVQIVTVALKEVMRAH